MVPKKKAKKQMKSEQGFSLIELLIAMAVVLVLVAGLVAAGAKALSASRETSAAQSMQSFANDVNIYQKNWGGYPVIAANMGSPATPTPAGTCTADQEIAPQSAATAYDAGFVSSGYTFKYLVSGTNQFAASGGPSCTAKVSSDWELTSSPTALSATKSYCSDPTGNFYIPASEAAFVNSGAGCATDGGGNALSLGQ